MTTCALHVSSTVVNRAREREEHTSPRIYMHHVSQAHSFRFFVRDIKIICFVWSRTPSDLTPKDTTNSGQHSNPPVFDFHGTEVLEVVPASSTKMRTSCGSDPVWKNITPMIKKSSIDHHLSIYSFPYCTIDPGSKKVWRPLIPSRLLDQAWWDQVGSHDRGDGDHVTHLKLVNLGS